MNLTWNSWSRIPDDRSQWASEMRRLFGGDTRGRK